MNVQDRAALDAIARQIETLTNGLEALEQLGKAETVTALEDLVRIAPTLKQLAKGYEAAGIAGNFIKWIAGLATAFGVLIAAVRFYMGDAK